MNSPIIFIHYGDSEYLKYTLRTALKFNKDKIVYLLGDSENQHYSKIGVHHVQFSKLHYGTEIEKFESSFRLVKGEQHEFNKYKGTDFWLRFVFLRWFYINNFLKENLISSFWTFDSDTLILSQLSKYERLLSNYDCTEQCGGSCMNGFVKRAEIVNDYVSHTNELFDDLTFLEEQQKEFQVNKSFAFTEMRAYLSFKERSGIKTARLSNLIKDEMFDDCLCHGEGMEIVSLKDGHSFKKLYQDEKSKMFFVYRENDKTFVKLNTINLSWLASYIIEEIFFKVSSPNIKNLNSTPVVKPIPLEYKNNYSERLIRKIKRSYFLVNN